MHGGGGLLPSQNKRDQGSYSLSIYEASGHLRSGHLARRGSGAGRRFFSKHRQFVAVLLRGLRCLVPASDERRHGEPGEAGTRRKQRGNIKTPSTPHAQALQSTKTRGLRRNKLLRQNNSSSQGRETVPYHTGDNITYPPGMMGFRGDFLQNQEGAQDKKVASGWPCPEIFS